MAVNGEPVFSHTKISAETRKYFTHDTNIHQTLEQGKDYDDPRLAGSYTQLAHRQLGRSRAESGLIR